MTEAGPALADALRASLLELAGLAGEHADAPAILANARRLWEAHCKAFGLVLLDDHDPHVAPGLHVARVPGALAPSRMRQLARSWETFDRAFEACSMEQEQALFDARIAPCFLAVGLVLAELDLARDHLFVIGERYAASFPEERWEAHSARGGAPASPAPNQERLVEGLRRLSAT